MAAKPTEAQIYKTPQTESTSAGPVDLGTSVSQAMSYDQRYHPHAAAEMNQDLTSAGPGPAATRPPAVGDIIRHEKNGQHGVIVGHERHGYSGTAMPQVQWVGEDKSWPQGVSPNAIRVVGSTPVDLYETTQDATSHPPLIRHS